MNGELGVPLSYPPRPTMSKPASQLRELHGGKVNTLTDVGLLACLGSQMLDTTLIGVFVDW